MKKILSLAAAILLAFSFAACGGKDNISVQEQTPTITKEITEPSSTPEISSTPEVTADSQSESVPKVYMTAAVSSEGLIDAYTALGREATGNVPLKSTRENPAQSIIFPPT